MASSGGRNGPRCIRGGRNRVYISWVANTHRAIAAKGGHHAHTLKQGSHHGEANGPRWPSPRQKRRNQQKTRQYAHIIVASDLRRWFRSGTVWRGEIEETYYTIWMSRLSRILSATCIRKPIDFGRMVKCALNLHRWNVEGFRTRPRTDHARHARGVACSVFIALSVGCESNEIPGSEARLVNAFNKQSSNSAENTYGTSFPPSAGKCKIARPSFCS